MSPRLAPLTLIVLSLSGFATSPARAGEPRFEARLEHTELAVGSRTWLVLELHDAEPSGPPALPASAGLLVRATAHERSFQAGPSGPSASLFSFTYQVTALAPGRFTLGPFAIEAAGTALRAGPLELHVLPAPRSSRFERPDDLYVSVEVSPLTPFVGEQILYVWRFFQGVKIEDARLGEYQPNGFQQQALGAIRKYPVEIGERPYQVHEFRQALFPQRTGVLEIAGPPLAVSFPAGGLLPRPDRPVRLGGPPVVRNLRTASTRLQVRPLPPEPPGFSGLIGDFALETRLSRPEIELGQATELTVTVRGRGNVELIPEPTLPELPRLLRFRDRPQLRLEKGDLGLSGEKVFAHSLMPQGAGEHTIPALELLYFDPSGEGAYRVARSRPLRLRVRAADAASRSVAPNPAAPNRAATSALPVSATVTPGAALPVVATAPVPSGLAPTWPALLGLSTALGLGALGWVWWRRRAFTAAPARPSAAERARAQLPDLDNALAAGYLREAAELASRVLRDYLGARLAVPGRALTAQELGERAAQAGLAPDLAAQTHHLLAALEAAQFAACTTQPPCTGAELARLLEALERK